MRTLISYFCIAFFTGMVALWTYSLPNSKEMRALEEISQVRQSSTPIAGLIP